MSNTYTDSMVSMAYRTLYCGAHHASEKGKLKEKEKILLLI